MNISIVVPIYNGEKFLPHLFNSLLLQSSKDFEVVFINDGSVDRSEELLLEFQKTTKDFKVVVETIKNSGQGAARELGVRLSSNPYICFVDVDDDIEKDYVEYFSSVIDKYHPDMVCSNYFVNDSKEVKDPKFADCLLNKDEIKKDIYPYLIQNNRYQYFLPSLWAKAFRKDLYLSNVCKSDIRVGEDIAVFIPAFLRCENVYLSSRCLYHYRVDNSSSVMKSRKPRSYSDVINLYNHLKEKLADQYQEFELQISRLIAHVAFNCSITQFYSDRPKKEIKKFISDNLNHEIIAKAIKEMDAKGFKAKLMRYALKHKSYCLMRLYSKVM